MSMDFQEIVSLALDEWNASRGDPNVDNGQHEAIASVAEDANKSFFSKTAKANFNAPKAPKAPATPKTETAQAKNTAQKPLGQQLFDLAKHDKSKHKGNFDPNTMSCKFRKEMAKSMSAMGLAIPEQVKKQLGEKNVKAAQQEGAKMQKSDERVLKMQSMTKERDKILAEKGKDSPEYKQAVENLFNARMDFARQMIGDEEADAGEGLVEIAVDDKDPEKQKVVKEKVGELFDKALQGDFTEAQNAELLAIGSKMGMDEECKALEDKLFKPDTGVNEEQMAGNVKENEQNEAIQEQMRAANAQSEPEEGEEAASGEENKSEENENAEPLPLPLPLPLPEAKERKYGDTSTNKSQPKGRPDELSIQALEETISEQDKWNSEDLSDYEKDARKTAIANLAAKYINEWSDLDDPEKREKAVALAIRDINKANEEGREIENSEFDWFNVNVEKGRSDISKSLEKARDNLNKVIADKNSTPEDRKRARDAFNEARKASDERSANPTETDLFEDQESAKKELDKVSADLDSANEQLKSAEEALRTAQESGDKDAIKAAKDAVQHAENAVETASQQKDDAQAKYDSAKEAFENYEPPKSEVDEVIARTREELESAGISQESLKKFEAVERMVAEDPSFYKKFPEFLNDFKKDAEAWTRIQPKNEAMKGLLTDLKSVAADDIMAGRLKRASLKQFEEEMKSDDPDIRKAAEIAKTRLENEEDPVKVRKEYAEETRKIAKERRTEELHSLKVQKELHNNATAAAKAFAAEQANKEKYFEKPVSETDPDIVQAIRDELGKEKDPARQSSLQKIIKTLESDTSKKNVDKALDSFEKGWSETAKDKNAVAKIKAMREKEDHLEKTWAESNKDGRMKDLDAAIETLGKRKDDAGKANASRLAEIRQELGTSHSEKRTEALLKEWSGIVGGGRSKTSAGTVSAEVEGVDHDNGGYLSDSNAPRTAKGVAALDGNTMSIDGKQFSSTTPTKASYSNLNAEKKYFEDAIGAELNTSGVNAEVISDILNTTLRFKLPPNQQVDIFAIKDSIARAMTQAARSSDPNAPSVKSDDITNIDYDRTNGELTYKVTNDKAAMIPFKSAVEHPSYQKIRDKYPNDIILPFGDGVNGKKQYLNLSKLVHLNIVGKTGGGKGMTARSFIAALEAFYPNAKYMICDAAKNGADYLEVKGSKRRIGEISGDDACSKNLAWAVKEMENRNASFAKGSNYMAHNAYANSPEGKAKGVKPMDPIVVICDEYAQLDNKAKADFKKLAKVARSSGIMLIAMTQHPDAKEMDTQTQQSFGGTIVHKMGEKDDAIVHVKGSSKQPGNGTWKYRGVIIDEDGNEIKTDNLKNVTEDWQKYVSGQALSVGEGDLEKLVRANDGASGGSTPKSSGSAPSSTSNSSSQSATVQPSQTSPAPKTSSAKASQSPSVNNGNGLGKIYNDGLHVGVDSDYPVGTIVERDDGTQYERVEGDVEGVDGSKEPAWREVSGTGRKAQQGHVFGSQNGTPTKVVAKPKSGTTPKSTPKVTRKDGESDADYIKRLEAALNGGNS